MRIERKRIDELRPALYNPRKDLRPGDPDYEKLKRSLSEFGYVEPVIWNERTGHIIGGHQRLKVLAELGETEIDCVVVDLDTEREKILNLSLNKISGEWDYVKLEELFSEFSLDELGSTGFDDDEIQKITSMVFDDDEIDDETHYGYSNEDEYSGVGSGEKPFKLYISFAHRKQAEEFLESEGFSQKFKDGKKRVLIRMGEPS